MEKFGSRIVWFCNCDVVGCLKESYLYLCINLSAALTYQLHNIESSRESGPYASHQNESQRSKDRAEIFLTGNFNP